MHFPRRKNIFRADPVPVRPDPYDVPIEPDLILPHTIPLPANFWLPTTTKLVLRVYGRHDEATVYGIQCPHGEQALKPLNEAERRDVDENGRPKIDSYGGALFYWGFAAVCSFTCDCGTRARAGGITQFLGDTPGWLSYVSEADAALDPLHGVRVRQAERANLPEPEVEIGEWEQDLSAPPGVRRMRRSVTILPSVEGAKRNELE